MNAKPRPIIQLAIAAMLVLTSVVVIAADDFPGGTPEQRLIEAQAKADQLFEKGDYQRAYFIFREELVPLGDKYAQYMVGYMNIVGKGVPLDVIAGSAWYRLAAERGEVNFSQVRDELWDQLNDEQRSQSTDRYAALRMEFSDAMIVASMIEIDLVTIQRLLQDSTLSNDLVDAQNSYTGDQSQLIAEAQQRVKIRLKFLADTIASGKPMADTEIAHIDDVEKRAQDLID